MPRKLLFCTDTLPYHITARVDNREEFYLSLPMMWKVVGSECLSLRVTFGIEFQVLVLMPNHLHMILTVPEPNLGHAMNVFMSNVTRESNRVARRSGHLFGGPYHWSLIDSSLYFGHALKYVYRNPVRAKICEKVEDYAYSTLHGLLGRSHLPFPIHFTRVGMEVGLPSDRPEQLLEWLNTPFAMEAEQLIQMGLRKRVFKEILCRKDRRPYEPLRQLI